VDHAALAHQERPLEAVLQLAHVARPVVRHQHVDRGGGDAAHVLAVSRRELLDEVVGQQRNVGAPLAQRGHEDLEHVQPVIEVLAEAARLHGQLEVLVGGGDHPHVDLHGLDSAQSLELALLQHAQQLDLGRRRQLADLVQEQRAAVGQLETALLSARASVKAPFS